MTHPAVREMTAADVEQVAAIERASFSTPWPAPAFREMLEREGVELLVLDDGEGGVIGYAVLWCVLDEGELANIAVAEGWRGRALGALLLAAILDRAVEVGVRRLFLEVRESNHVARKLYRSRGFVEIGRRADYYREPREDARVLLKILPAGDDGSPKDSNR